ncbi:MAG TPA: hypothetical protein P5274_00925 [Candidatus Paceibacterota bacterium]|nr:hypothetical protein [Candidatus Paceibacterota bacterium]
MRNFNSRSFLSYLLIISIFLFISVVGFNFVVKAVGSPRISAIYLSSPLTTWPAGAEKVISVRYSDFPSVGSSNLPSVTSTFYVWLCNPKTNDCTRFGWPLDNLRLSGSRTVNIKRTIPSNTYDRLKAKDKTLTPYYNGYQAKLKICPSTLAGSASSYGCLYSPVFTVTDPKIVPPEITVPPEETTIPSVSSATFLAPVSSWPVGTAKTVKVAYANLGGNFKTVDISMCDPSTNLCNIINTPNLNLSGSNNVNISQAIGIDDYDEGYQGQLKVCPHPTVAVPKSTEALAIRCATTTVFTITKEPVVNSVVIENISSGWQEKTIKAINFNYISFDDIYDSVKVRICHPTAIPSRCKDLPDPVLGLLTGNGSTRIAVTFPALSEATSYLSNGSTKLKICPRRSSNDTALATGCAYSSNFLVTATPVVIPPTISSVTISDIASGWPASTSKAVNFSYSSFDNSTKYVKARLCHPSATSTEISKCFVSSPDSADSGALPTSGTGSITKAIGPLVYDRLSQTPPDQTLTPYFEGYTTKWKVCPTNSAGVVPAGAVCSFSPIFSVTDPDIDPDTSGSLPSGQGCFVDECVCFDGMRMKCGSPMQPGTGCETPTNCNAYQASLPSKFLASINFAVGSIISLFIR